MRLSSAGFIEIFMNFLLVYLVYTLDNFAVGARNSASARVATMGVRFALVNLVSFLSKYEHVADEIN